MPVSELTWMQRNNLTPAKMGLVIVLAAVFLGVVVYQLIPIIFSGGELAPAVLVNRPKPSVKPSVKARVESPPAATMAPVMVEKDCWPAFAVDEVAAHDPFRLPGELRQALIAEMQRRETEGDAPRDSLALRRERLLEEMNAQGVSVVVLDGDRSVAAIGELELKVGDIVDGLLVKSIGREGIEFVKVDSSSPSRQINEVDR